LVRSSASTVWRRSAIDPPQALAHFESRGTEAIDELMMHTKAVDHRSSVGVSQRYPDAMSNRVLSSSRTRRASQSAVGTMSQSANTTMASFGSSRASAASMLWIF